MPSQQLLLPMLLAGLTAAAAAQTATPQTLRPELRPVTVTGHVLCADTQRPARLANVRLVRLPARADYKLDSKPDAFNAGAPAGDPVETNLDGSYTLRNVKPGEYYVVVDLEGYLLPLSAFSLKDLAQPTEEIKQQIDAAVHPVTVLPGQATQADVVLERGASVSGAVLYDDGSPASGIGIELLHKDSGGKWVSISRLYRAGFQFPATDEDGHYRVTGLPPGEYATQANLALNDFETTTGPMPNGGKGTVTFQMQKTRFSLPLYSGNVLHRTDAKAYTLGSGEVRAGADLEFPLAKLHKVGGQLLTRNGHVLNGGKVTLLYPDDKSEMTEAEVQYDDQQFHLEYVPEGDFLMKVTGAEDRTKIQVENAAGYVPRTHEESKTLKTYGDTQQDLTVKGDTSDVTVLVPENKPAK